MQYRKSLLALTGITALAFAPAPATAGLMIATYTGVIYNNGRGGDAVGDFGIFSPPGTDLSGQKFKATYIYDPDDARYVADHRPITPYPNGFLEGYSRIFGPIAASLEIDSKIFTMSWGSVGIRSTLYARPDGDVATSERVSHGAEGQFDGVTFRMSNTVGYGYPDSFEPFLNGLSLTQTMDFCPKEPDYTDFYFIHPVEEVWITTFYMRNDRLTVAPYDSPVPEPATWAMMIAGFGLVGGIARRRRGTLAAA
jgi:hypothetical protein